MTIRVAIADDSEDIRVLVRAALTSYGDFEIVGEAGTGAEAVALVERLEPDVVVLDLSMPVMGGLAALPEIRRVSPDTRVVVFSGYNEDQFGANASSLGAQGYGIKGIHPKALSALVEKSVSDGRPRVLVVEEGSADWVRYTSALSTAGNVVSRAASVKDAVALVTYRNFDLVVLGMRLSDGSGLDVLVRLEAMDSHMPLPVVVTLTGEADPPSVNRAFELGAVACVAMRRVSPEDFAAAVPTWLDRGADRRSP